MKFLQAFIIFLSTTNCFAQIKIDIDVHTRVNQKNKEVASILEVYKAYLNNRPDSIQTDNPFWCTEDKSKYQDFDFTRGFIYDQLPIESLCKLYRFVILSIEKEEESYAIRTAIIAKDLTQPYIREQNPWAITRLYAIKENNSWKLKNAFDFKIKGWKRISESNINYHFPIDINIDKEVILKSKSFCDSAASLLQVKNWQPFDYYITNSGDKESELLGFDFAVSAYTTGMAFKNNILLGGTSSAFYPHEFVHHVAEEKKIKHKLINEGLATWLGGSNGRETFEQNLHTLSNAIKNNDTITVDKVIDLTWGWTVDAYYTTGGLFCKLVYEKHGLIGLNKLFSIPANDNKKLREELMKLLKTKNLNEVWKKELAKH
jgi:hypothetical protein